MVRSFDSINKVKDEFKVQGIDWIAARRPWKQRVPDDRVLF